MNISGRLLSRPDLLVPTVPAKATSISQPSSIVGWTQAWGSHLPCNTEGGEGEKSKPSKRTNSERIQTTKSNARNSLATTCDNPNDDHQYIHVESTKWKSNTAGLESKYQRAYVRSMVFGSVELIAQR